MNKFLLPLLLLPFAGCQSASYLKTDNQPNQFLPTQAESIAVFSDANTGNKEFEIVGEVVAAKDGQNAKGSVLLLKRSAAEMGADAIINLRLEIVQGYWAAAVKSSGTAIKFK